MLSLSVSKNNYLHFPSNYSILFSDAMVLAEMLCNTSQTICTTLTHPCYSIVLHHNYATTLTQKQKAVR